MRKQAGYISFESIKSTKLEELKNQLGRLIVDVEARDISIGELCPAKAMPNGVYLFYDRNKTLQYVGKSTSRSFVERIPAHFDPRETSWFNTLPKKMSEQLGWEYGEAHKKVLSFRLVMIGVDCNEDEGKRSARVLEKVLRHYLKPELNTPKKRNQYNSGKSIGALLK